MSDTKLCYGVPACSLQRVEGGHLIPSALVGRDFVIFFCPADPAIAVREIEAYRACAKEFEHAGAWVIGVLARRDVPLPEQVAGAARVALTVDPAQEGWSAFESLLGAAERSPAADGGAFLFGRGGCLIRAWAGSGHAPDVLRELRRSS